MVQQIWVIIGAAAGVLAATWLWYVLESRHLRRGTRARHMVEKDE
jgi:uncharacterized membrane protein YccC